MAQLHEPQPCVKYGFKLIQHRALTSLKKSESLDSSKSLALLGISKDFKKLCILTHSKDLSYCRIFELINTMKILEVAKYEINK